MQNKMFYCLSRYNFEVLKNVSFEYLTVTLQIEHSMLKYFQ